MRPAVALLVGGALATALSACSGDDGAEPGAPATSGAAPPPAPSVYDLAVGDCLNGLDARQDLTVRLVPCPQPHEAEVYGAFDVPGTGADGVRYPGVEVLRRRVATDCSQQFTLYTGEAASVDTDLAFTEIVPTLQSWTAGDRGAVCLVVGPNGRPLRGSVRQR